MGAYLSEPLTTKNSEEFSNDYLASGASSMQGWRVSQEVSFALFYIYFNDLHTKIDIIMKNLKFTWLFWL